MEKRVRVINVDGFRALKVDEGLGLNPNKQTKN